MAATLKTLFTALIQTLKFISKSPTPLAPPPNQTFHPFRLLPTEIRLQIWDLAIPHPRLVFISSRTRYIAPASVKKDESQWTAGSYLQRLKADMIVESCHGVPATLHACTESRERAQRVYEKAWERGEGCGVLGDDAGEEESDREDVERMRDELGWKYTWVNYNLDLIVFDHA